MQYNFEQQQKIKIMSTIAQTILSQLGGNKFIAMTGVKNLTASECALNMQLPVNDSKAKYLTIELSKADTYTVTFMSMDRKFNLKTVAQKTGVYAEMLKDIFTSTTGLKTSLS